MDCPQRCRKQHIHFAVLAPIQSLDNQCLAGRSSFESNTVCDLMLAEQKRPSVSNGFLEATDRPIFLEMPFFIMAQIEDRKMGCWYA
ncbi:hypothetical protein CH35J_006272 [Colletotrichum higginsianum]|uniref:Uncharacterized protein n=1 Tax=Colletotrichum higginsianum TaxID=80884 RepID=A0A4T0W2B0_9PEZI|nr:hypothetical protein CH35J_006272 [Colletotrichum higginsianum]